MIRGSPRAPAVVRADAEVHEAAVTMLQFEGRHLPVVDGGGAVVGKPSVCDLLGSAVDLDRG